MRFDQGVTRKQTCLALGVSVGWGHTFEHAMEQDPDELERLRRLETGGLPSALEYNGGAPIPLERLTDLARRCLDDFELFRATCLGRRSLPWAIDAAQRVAELYETPDREFVCLNVAPGAGKPVSVDELVTMADGSRKRLGDVRVGDWVITHTGQPRPVEAVHEQGRLPVVAVHTRLGRRVVAANDHPFLTERGFVDAADLQPGDFLPLVSFNPVAGTYRTAEEFRLAGYFVGDGCTTLSNSSFTSADLDTLNDFEMCAKTLGWETSRWIDPRGKGITSRCTAQRSRYGPRAWLEGTGLRGSSSHTKRVPGWVWSAPNDRVAEFIGAYFACDGTVEPDGASIEFYSVNRALLVDVRSLLTRFGIASSLRLKKGRYRGAVHISWRLTVLHRQRFAEAIPVVGAKAQRLGRVAQRRPFLFHDEVTAIEPVGEAECRCLTVPVDHSFVVGDLPVSNTTLGSTDIPLWLTARDRAIRGAVGSVKLQFSVKMVSRVKREFERLTPVRPTESERVNRNACDAQATMGQLFGRFRPLTTGVWRQDGFLVEQLSQDAAVQKELTWSAASIEGDFIAERLNFMSWDDATTVSRARSTDIRERDQESWDRQIEERLEPGGLLLLVGQRIHTADLYRWNLNKYVELEGGDEDEPVRVRKYHHIVYRAHDETVCKGDHGKDAKPWPKGCLLDPVAKPWRELKRKLDEDPDTFHLVEQQDDTTQKDQLVQRVWLEGGQDRATKVYYEGCIDKALPLGTMPNGLPGKLVSYCTVDPSASNYWCIQWWLHDPETGFRWLIDMRRRRMSSSELIEAIPGRVDECRGLMVDWQARSEKWRRPIRWWIIEQNGAQRYLLQQAFIRRWAQMNNTRLLGHETFLNKSDAKLGVRGLLTPIYRNGLVKIPAHPDTLHDVRWFLDELMSWPNTVTQDGVMAQWMGEHNLSVMVRQNKEPELVQAWRPSWLAGEQGPSRAQLALMRSR